MTNEASKPTPRYLDPSFYATRPTRSTVFLRTFVPWQLWRFLQINLRMLKVIGISHRGQH